MYCKSCLASNPPGATVCTQCGAVLVDDSPAAVPNPELELQPEHPKVPDVVPPPPHAAAGAVEGVAGGDEVVAEGPPMPPDHKTNAIIMLIVSIFILFPISCCCWFCFPFIGIAGIVFAILALMESGNVKALYEAGDYEGAEAASKAAQKWIKTGLVVMAILFGIGVIGYIVYVVIYGGASMVWGTKNYFNKGN